MKTERRQELNTNVLADWLGQRITAIAPFGRAITGIAIIGGVLAFVFFYLNAQNRTSLEENWTAYFNRSEEHTSELQSLVNLVCRLLLEKKKKQKK